MTVLENNKFVLGKIPLQLIYTFYMITHYTRSNTCSIILIISLPEIKEGKHCSGAKHKAEIHI